MDLPKLQINDQSPVAEDPVPKANGQGEDKSSARKALHQSIIPKLRPLPLQYHWTFWHDKHSSDSTASYDTRLFVLHEDVADIATFYRVYNNYPWDRIRLRDSVHIFRRGVKPIWEDPENIKGGCWRFRVPRTKAQAFFHEIAILCIANEFQAVLEEGTSSSFSLIAVTYIVWIGPVANADQIMTMSSAFRPLFASTRA